MICYRCRKAADEDRQDLHCETSGCTCAHQPLGACLPEASE